MSEAAGATGRPRVEVLAERLLLASGASVRSVVLYGSHLLGTGADEHSAIDLLVVVGRYRDFYEQLGRAGELHRPVWLMASMARVLPPNVIAFAPDREHGPIAKCLIVTKEHLERALGRDPPDHFLLGRMVQKVVTVWASSEAEGRWLDERLSEARAGVLEWMAPYLHEPVDGAGLGRRLLEVCYRGELRPEARDRADRIFEAQVDHFRSRFTPVLEAGVATGRLRKEGARYALLDQVAPADRRRWSWHFRRSKIRATARWLKHTVTFANWLPYVVRKVERHTGRTIRLTRLERRLPLVFLWPRAIHVLLTRPGRGR